MLRKYLLSTDHKIIGLLYGFTSLFFLLVGFALVLLIRWQHDRSLAAMGAGRPRGVAPSGVMAIGRRALIP